MSARPQSRNQEHIPDPNAGKGSFFSIVGVAAGLWGCLGLETLWSLRVSWACAIADGFPLEQPAARIPRSVRCEVVSCGLFRYGKVTLNAARARKYIAHQSHCLSAVSRRNFRRIRHLFSLYPRAACLHFRVFPGLVILADLLISLGETFSSRHLSCYQCTPSPIWFVSPLRLHLLHFNAIPARFGRYRQNAKTADIVTSSRHSEHIV